MKDFVNLIDRIPTFAKVLLCLFTMPYGILLAAAFFVAIPVWKGELGASKGKSTFNHNGSGADFDLHHNHMQDEMDRQFNEWSMEESRKAVTPFDHGGYMRGEGFNPSDTMAAEANRQMDSMNHMNDFNNMGGMGMF